MVRDVGWVGFFAVAIVAGGWLALSATGDSVEPVWAATQSPPSSAAITPIPPAEGLDPQKIALGERLFNDPRFSRDNTISCASCHSLAKGGADGLPRSRGIGGQEAARNAPSVFNVAFNYRQFWDGRAATLHEQMDGPVHNPREMNTTWPDIIAKLAGDPGIVAQIAEIYGNGVTTPKLKDAIATFERSLLTPDSRFDRFLKGSPNALRPDEARGYQLFKNYGCISCHQGVNIGGNMFAKLGAFTDLPRTAPASRDPGLKDISKREQDLFVFRVPSLRNVALTAPYFHDGSVPTLEQAVRLMGVHQLGITIPDAEIALIVKFLGTLNGEHQGKPL